MFKTNVMSKKHSSFGDGRQSDFQHVTSILKHNENTATEINKSFLKVLSAILRYHHAQTKVMSKKQTSPGIEQQSDHPGTLHILGNNGNTLSKRNNHFLDVLSPIVRYHHAQTKVMSKEQTSLGTEQQSDPK